MAGAAGLGIISGNVTQAVPGPWNGTVIVQAISAVNGEAYSDEIGSVGEFSMDVPPGTYRIYYDYQGMGNFLDVFFGGAFGTTGATVVTVEEAQTFDASLVQPAGGSISGTLTGETGALSEPTITATSVPSTPLNEPWTVIQPNGEYTINGLQPGSYRVKFEDGSDWRPEWWQGKFSAGTATSIPIALGQNVTGVDVALERATAISGTVTALTGGAPMQGVQVSLNTANQQGVKTTATDINGHYRFTSMPPGTYFVCFSRGGFVSQCWDSEFAPGTAIPIAYKDEVTGVDIALGTPSTISGSVTHRPGGGAPVPLVGAAVFLYYENDGPWSLDLVHSYAVADGANAEFSFTGLQPGNYIVGVRDNEFGNDIEYYSDKLYLADGDLIEVGVQEQIQLGALELNPGEWYPERIAGIDRFSTGVQISRASFPGAGRHLPVLYIANGMNYPDALSAGPAATAQGGGVLLVAPDAIPAAVLGEIQRLDPQRIVVAGSAASVSDAVFDQLQDLVPNTVRIGGESRYETSEKIVRDAFPTSTHVAFFVTGRNYPDALSAGPAASHLGGPVILVDGAAGALSAATKQLIRDYAITDVRIAGSWDSVSFGIESSFYDTILPFGTPTVERYNGASRYDTAAFVNEDVFDNVSHFESVVIASGAGFADALAGGTLAGARDVPMYLSQPTCLPGYVANFAASKGVKKVTFLGGPGTISDSVVAMNGGSYC